MALTVRSLHSLTALNQTYRAVSCSSNIYTDRSWRENAAPSLGGLVSAGLYSMNEHWASHLADHIMLAQCAPHEYYINRSQPITMAIQMSPGLAWGYNVCKLCLSSPSFPPKPWAGFCVGRAVCLVYACGLPITNTQDYDATHQNI